MMPLYGQMMAIFDGLQWILFVLAVLLLLAQIVILRKWKGISPVVSLLLILVQAVVAGTGLGVCWQTGVLVSDYSLTGSPTGMLLALATVAVGFSGMVVSLVHILNWLTGKFNRNRD